MMENYFNVFKASIQLDSKQAASPVSKLEREEIIQRLASGSQNPPGVRVTISQAAQEPATVAPITSTSDISVHEPKNGVMVKRDSANYLSGYQGMDKRISMVEVDDNGEEISSGSLKSVLQNIESNAISLFSLVEDSGGFDSPKSGLHGRVELGNIRGGEFLFDGDGNIVGQKYVGIVDTVKNESQVSLNLSTGSGKEIKLDLLLSDEMSQQGVKGVSRDIDFSYSASHELNQQEVEGLSSILESLTGAFASFHVDWSMTQEEADVLVKSMLGESDVFSSMNAQLKMEKGALHRVINFSLNGDGAVEIESNENGMDVAYDVALFSADTLHMHMGDSRTNLGVLKEMAETNNSSLAYKAAIDSANSAAPMAYGEYVSSFFDSAQNKP